MYQSATYWIVLLMAGPLSAAQLPAPRPVVPAEPRTAGPVLDEVALPPPRLAPRPPPASPIAEEPAPAPHELPARSVPHAPPQAFHEETAPTPHLQTPLPARFSMPHAPPDPALLDLGALHREVERLRMEREAMLVEEMDLITSKDLRSAKDNGASLRMRVAELLAKVAQQTKKVEGKSNPQPSNLTPPPSNLNPPCSDHSPAPTQTPRTNGGKVESGGKKEEGNSHLPPSTLQLPPSTHSIVTDAPVDPLALAQSLFRAGDYTAALNAYRKLDKEDQKPEDRIVIQYMMACCLRKLGKVEEASVLYREAANSPGNDFLMENAQWYLRIMKDRRELEAQLEELRQRRQAVKSRKQ